LGLVTPAEVTDTGRRLFDDSVFSRLELIKQLNQSGYTLRDIRETFFSRH
jgi:DNA-binding transcriptional MerR regulator